MKEKKAFQWQSQLKQRYENGEAKLAIADARFSYQFEYLGESSDRHMCRDGINALSIPPWLQATAPASSSRP